MVANQKIVIKEQQAISARNLVLRQINFSIIPSAIALSFALVSTSLMSNPLPTIIGCHSNATPGIINLEMVASSSIDTSGEYVCPLLEERKFRKLVDKFGVGSVFAYPLIPDSCLTGVVQSGTIQIGASEIQIDPTYSYSESANRLFPVPVNQAPPGSNGIGFNASSVDATLHTVAALTLIHLEGDDSNGISYTLDILANDSTLLTETGEDTDEFTIIGSKGRYKVTGRLTGRGQLFSQSPIDLTMNVFGTVCLKNQWHKPSAL